MSARPPRAAQKPAPAKAAAKVAKRSGPRQAEAAQNRPFDLVGGERPHEAFASVALVLQGGGALGSYQAGAYQGLNEARVRPNWVAGISIGSLNAAIIAGNPPDKRVAQLRAFWDHICQQPWWPRLPYSSLGDHAQHLPESVRRWISQIEASRSMNEGQNGFFTPRPLPPMVPGMGDATQASYYDTSPLRQTLLEFADFKLINQPKTMRVSVGAVQVRSGNFVYFDNTERTLRPEHFMASGALPPGFPAVEVDGELYWDGGLVSNTPLLHVLQSEPREDMLIFQVDLWSARGKLPTTLPEVQERLKDIQYSSRTRMITDYMHQQQLYRKQFAELLALLPPGKRNDPVALKAAELACNRRCNVIQLIYQDKPYESDAKDYEFGQLAPHEHWASGLADVRHTLDRPQWLAMPSAERPFVTHDVHRLRER